MFNASKKQVAATVATLGFLIQQAQAAVPADVSTEMASGKTDAAAVAALALLIVIGVAVVKYMRRAV